MNKVKTLKNVSVLPKTSSVFHKGNPEKCPSFTIKAQNISQHRSLKTASTYPHHPKLQSKVSAVKSNFLSFLHSENFWPVSSKHRNQTDLHESKNIWAANVIFLHECWLCAAVFPLSTSNLLTGIIQVCRWPARDRYLPQHTTCCLILYDCVKLDNCALGSKI